MLVVGVMMVWRMTTPTAQQSQARQAVASLVFRHVRLQV